MPVDDSRRGRCYELACKAVLFLEQPTHLLVHGTIHRLPYPPNAHAWVIRTDGAIWEPVTEIVFAPAIWEAWANPTTIHTYTPKEVYELAFREMHTGPWDELALG